MYGCVPGPLYYIYIFYIFFYCCDNNVIIVKRNEKLYVNSVAQIMFVLFLTTKTTNTTPSMSFISLYATQTPERGTTRSNPLLIHFAAASFTLFKYRNISNASLQATAAFAMSSNNPR